MKEHFEGLITEIRREGTVIYNVLLPAVICNRDKCLPVEMLVDTGSDKNMISYRFGLELGLEHPGKKDKTKTAYDVNNREIHYIPRKVKILLGNGIEKEMNICWCTAPRINKNFLGMDFFDKHKLIIVGGKRKKFYITKVDNCVKCSSK